MHFSLATVAAVAALLPAFTNSLKTGRTFAVLRFQGNGNGDGALVTARMDPVVQPGQVSAHLHTIMGGNAFSMDMPGTAATKSTCTNSKIKNDKSNYWTPSMFFKEKNGTFTPVPLFYMNVYYFFEATDDEIVPFPDGFRMVAGDSTKRSPPATGGNVLDPNQGTIQPVQFTCPRQNDNTPLYTAGAPGVPDPTGPNGRGAGFPDQNCDGYASPLRADIHFPSCYNPAAGPEAYGSNTAYPTSKGAKNGANCPAGWLHVPHLFFEVYWNTLIFKDRWTPGQGKQPFVLSNGDPTGYSLHGDFINGWDTNTLKTIINSCDAGDSGMDKCPQIPGGLNDDQTCFIQSPIKETVTGNMAALPGCNPLQYGPAAAQKMTCDGSSPVVVPAPAASSSKPASVAPVVPASKPTTTYPVVVSAKPTTLYTSKKPVTTSKTTPPSSAKPVTPPKSSKYVAPPKPKTTKYVAPKPTPTKHVVPKPKTTKKPIIVKPAGYGGASPVNTVTVTHKSTKTVDTTMHGYATANPVLLAGKPTKSAKPIKHMDAHSKLQVYTIVEVATEITTTTKTITKRNAQPTTFRRARR